MIIARQVDDLLELRDLFRPQQSVLLEESRIHVIVGSSRHELNSKFKLREGTLGKWAPLSALQLWEGLNWWEMAKREIEKAAKKFYKDINELISHPDGQSQP